LNSIGLRQLPWGRPVKVERVVDDPKGDEKVSFLNLKRENRILQNLEGTFNDRR